MVYTDTVQHGGELVPVFGVVNALGACAEDGHILRIETHGKVVRYLAARRNDYAMRILQFEDVHDTLEGEFVKIEAVAHIVVRGYSFGVVINHHAAVALLADSVQRLHTAPVKLYRGADAVRARTEHNDRLTVAQVMHIIGNAAIRQVQVVGPGGIFGGKGIYLFHYGQDAHALAESAYGKNTFFTVHVLFQAKGTGYLEIGEALNFCFPQ